MILTDDLGRTVTLSGPVRRLVSLSPAVSENVFAIGAGALLVGVTTADDYPPQVKSLPRVGDFGRPAIERILSLRPDLAIVEIDKADKATVDNASRRMRVPILVQSSHRYADVPRHLRQLGTLTGQTTKAEAAARQMESTLAQVQKQKRNGPPPTVFVEVSPSPLYGAGPGSFVDDLLKIVGAVNVLKGTTAYPVVSKEALLVANPAHYIVAVGGDMNARGNDTALPPPLDKIAAARTGNIHRIPADLLFRPTPRLASGLMALASALYKKPL